MQTDNQIKKVNWREATNWPALFKQMQLNHAHRVKAFRICRDLAKTLPDQFKFTLEIKKQFRGESKVLIKVTMKGVSFYHFRTDID